MSDKHETAGRGISMRSAEIVVALLVLVMGAVVVYDSLRLGAKWAEDGPEAGYFPFYIGALICIGGGVTLIRALLGKGIKKDALFVEFEVLKPVLSVLLPAAVFVFGIQMIGIYVASALYIAVFMVWLGKYSWLRGVLVGGSVSTVMFMTFEVWFKVPLFKGEFNPLSFIGY
jgi:hypothetical protein